MTYQQWGISSAGRAPALHAGGQRFEPAILHQFESFALKKLAHVPLVRFANFLSTTDLKSSFACLVRIKKQ